jgi:hypothetical protein
MIQQHDPRYTFPASNTTALMLQEMTTKVENSKNGLEGMPTCKHVR